MHPIFTNEIAVLKPMFKEIDAVIKTRNNYIVMGQICIAKVHRGKGVLGELYENMKTLIPKNFTKIITEVDTKNTRSLNAHLAISFKELKRYWVDDKEWFLIVFQIKLLSLFL